MSLKNQEAIIEAAGVITLSLDMIAATSDGADLSGLDDLLPKQKDYK